MDFYRSLDPRQQRILKIAGIVAVAIIFLSIALNAWRPISPFQQMGRAGVTMGVAPAPAYDMAYSEQSSVAYGKGGGVALSTRNMMPIVPGYGGTTGSDAEEFEVTDYSATIETTDLEGTCGSIVALKAKPYVIFENSSSYDRGCNHTFKVAHANVAEVLAVIKGLDPRDLSENTQTIKNQIDDYTSEETILRKKLASINETMEKAQAAYDEITNIATRANDAESLAKIIDSKIQVIERLTQESINVSAQLERLARSKNQQLDRLEYTYFNVNVYENRYVDGKSIKDSWKEALRQFVYNTNRLIQDITIGLVAFILVVGQYIIYAIILLLIAKYGWRYVKGYWNR